jgi:dUTP pyrophosphatase
MILSKEEIRELIEKEKLIQNFISLKHQLTPNGFDLTVKKIFGFESEGKLDFSNKERILSELKEIKPVKEKKENKYGWWNLKKGCYLVETNEIVKLPLDLMAMGKPRSSSLRMGITINTGYWDSGFEGTSQFLLIVLNPNGVKIKENARICQIIFARTKGTKGGYNGVYQGYGVA